MRYMGSKARFAAALLAIMLAARMDGRMYVEPFLGGANTFDRVPGPKLGGDENGELIAMWDAVAAGWVPPQEVSVEDYAEARRQSRIHESERTLAPEYIGFVGVGCSFGGKWFGGYARSVNANGLPRNHAAESSRAVLKQAAGIRGAAFFAGRYQDIPLGKQALVYCDPPYRGTTSYAGLGAFDTEAFWAWCAVKADAGHTLFVSEYAAPEGWECVWEKETPVQIMQTGRGEKTAVERLFRRAA